MFATLFYISFTVFILGVIYKLSGWFTLTIGSTAADFSPRERLWGAAKGLWGVFFSADIIRLAKAFLLDVVLLGRTYRESPIRWVMHLFIFWGFVLLLGMHALQSVISETLFEDYYSTRNPFWFLRDLSGFFVLLGLAIAGWRRFPSRRSRPMTNRMDFYAIILLAAVIFSGILLEGVKLSAHSEFQRMVEDYAGMDDEAEIAALESLWVQEFGLASPNVEGPFDPETLEMGREIHDLNCADCHAPARWAFTGYGTAKAIRPIARVLDQAGGVTVFWYLHILASFFGLAYLPFSKLFHLFATPVSLLTGSMMDANRSRRENIITRQGVELDACTHCGTCSRYCSAMMAYDVRGNSFILPSEKMVYLKRLTSGSVLSAPALRAIQEGIYLCTNCDRCTVVCPSGIRLKDLWVNVREDLIQRGLPEPLMLSPFSLLRGLGRKAADNGRYPKPLEIVQRAVKGDFDLLTDAARTLPLGGKPSGMVDRTFSYCFGCQNCTTVCPVVGNYSEPQQALGLLPHQIMCALGLGLDQMASGARMVWDCVTCYQCQEHCPQNVHVTDLLYGLKHMAVKNLRGDSE